MSDLVERLRKQAAAYRSVSSHVLAVYVEDEAAYALDALQAKLEAAENEIEELKGIHADIGMAERMVDDHAAETEKAEDERDAALAEIARLKALLAEASDALTPFALAASHQMVLAQASFNLTAVVWEKLDAAK